MPSVWGTKMTPSGEFLASLILAATFTGSAWAGSHEGSGQGEISGYDVNNVHFELSPHGPATITAVTFSLEPDPLPAAQVSAEIAGHRYACLPAFPAFVCRPSATAALLAAADSLIVTAGP